MARTVLQDVDRVLASAWYKAWALVHRTDAEKIRLERSGSRRPLSLDSWARCFIEAIRVALATPLPPPPPEDPPPPPSPAVKRLAPMTHYTTARADARYCVRAMGVTQIGPDRFQDEGGFVYTENGLCHGGRSGKFVSVLKPADSMDGMEPCDGYEKDGRRFPPWPAESYEV